jgi:CDGSH-type Zn-finger protein
LSPHREMPQGDVAHSKGISATIQAYPDGPLIVRGDVEVQDHLGNALVPAGRTVALCRCGRSALKPLCDGNHKKGSRRFVDDDAHPVTGQA